MLTALPRPTTLPTALRGPVGVRVAIYGQPAEPPAISDIVEPDAGRLIERSLETVAGWSNLPIVALREIIENLAHAGFCGALVSVLDAGTSVRVSDLGPGIPDKQLASLQGYSTADAELRTLIRGVGSGLPIARHQLERVGGHLEVCDNIGQGTVVTLTGAVPSCDRVPVDLDQDARHLLALLVELASADTETLATELGLSVPDCGRALALLEHRSLVSRSACGHRSITPRGNDLIASLF